MLVLPGVGTLVPAVANPDGSLFNRMVGFLDGTPVQAQTDPGDTFVLDWAHAGWHLGLTLATTDQGSALDDGRLTVWHEDSQGNWSVLNAPTTSVSGLQVPDDGRLAVQVTSASGQAGPDRFYLVLATLGP